MEGRGDSHFLIITKHKIRNRPEDRAPWIQHWMDKRTNRNHPKNETFQTGKKKVSKHICSKITHSTYKCLKVEQWDLRTPLIIIFISPKKRLKRQIFFLFYLFIGIQLTHFYSFNSFIPQGKATTNSVSTSVLFVWFLHYYSCSGDRNHRKQMLSTKATLSHDARNNSVWLLNP